jgi:hypothetical protein
MVKLKCSVCGMELGSFPADDESMIHEIPPCQRCLEIARLEGGNEALERAVKLCGCKGGQK